MFRHALDTAHYPAGGTGEDGGFPWRELLSRRRRLGPKTDAVEAGTGNRMGTIRADFKTHRNNRWDALVLLPIFRKLLLEMLQEFDLVMCTPPASTRRKAMPFKCGYGIQTDIRWTVLGVSTCTERPRSPSHPKKRPDRAAQTG